MEVDGAVLDAQFGFLNFHVKRYKDSGTKLTVTMKHKWAADWMRLGFIVRFQCKFALKEEKVCTLCAHTIVR
jgi:hypothetical protein